MTALFLAASILSNAPTQDAGPLIKYVWPKTKAERTNFAETSSYEDVIEFIAGLKRVGAPIVVTFSGVSTKGKAIPLIIASRPIVRTPQEAIATGKPIVYIQANIHGGEVEGKEASLHLLRRYLQQTSGLLDKLILLVQPIYNIDGNDTFGPQARNRPGQNGPERVGQRANGQNFDLNRDCTKVESPEMRGALSHIYPWNPDVVFDLHTTDGTRHGYPLTYSGPLHANTNPALATFSLDTLLPNVRKQAKRTFGLELFDYGNGTRKDGKWEFATFASEGRYVTNYGGLRNAISILSEAMVYEPFDIRVRDTERFVDLCLQQIARRAKQIKKLTADSANWNRNLASNRVQLALRTKPKLRGVEPVLIEKDYGKKTSGPIRDAEPILMPVFDRFEPTVTARVPYGYLVTNPSATLIKLLQLHGLPVEILREPWEGFVEAFRIGAARVAPTAFQGHKLIELVGSYSSLKTRFNENTLYIPNEHPLAALAFELLEPESIDGVIAWGYCGETFSIGQTAPIYKVFERISPVSVRPIQN